MDLRNHLLDGKMQILMSYMCVCFEDGYFFFFFWKFVEPIENSHMVHYRFDFWDEII